MTCFGKYQFNNNSCIGCKLARSCKREKIKIFNTNRKSSIVLRNLNNINIRSQSVNYLGNAKIKVLQILSKFSSPISTTKLIDYIKKDQDISADKIFQILNDLKNGGYLIILKKGNGKYWITISNYQNIRI